MLCAAPAYIGEAGLPQSPPELPRHQQIGFLLASTGKMRPIQLR